ncbi:RNA binding protein, cold-inducible rrm [Legionella busanensis]|uniref:RNA binding protein, cold-inducible rrm n=1 Tax=Legionella busanensis TaxID=190655 RepID=A0A378KBG9_9GAMM|nr:MULTISPECIES: RNA-binding protein [Legionella]STX81513.1 RNA binding protein, cold-inducible rrm [Legionella busanensis]
MNQRTLYIAHLPFSATAHDIETAFCKYGKIVEFDLVKDRFTGQSKGIAFITFSSQEEAEKALSMNGKQWLGRTLKVTQVQSRVVESITPNTSTDESRLFNAEPR